MKRNLFLLAILLSFFGKVFSQPCPATLSPSLYWTQPNVIFDTVGIWNTYPGIPLGSYTGEEKVMSFYSSCEAVLLIITENNLSTGGYNVLYKQHQATCSTQNFVQAPYATYSGNRVDYLFPVDSGVYYDFVFEYQPYNGTPKIKGNVNIGLYHSAVDSINFFNIYPDSVSIAWSSMYQNVEVKYAPVGSPLVSTIVHSNQVTLTGLTPGTKYNFYVKQTCDSYSSYQSFTLKTPPVCANAPIISCDNSTFYPTQLTTEPGSFSLPGCYSSCTMNQTQLFYKFIPDTSGNFVMNHVTSSGSSIRMMGIYYKDATMGCNEKNWNFVQCGTDKLTWSGNMGPLVAGHTYYLLFSTSPCYFVGSFANNAFRLTCPSPLCSSPATGLSSNAPGNTICSGKVVSLFPNVGTLSSTGFYKWYKDSCSGTPIGNTKIITVSPAVTKTYYLQISDSCGTLACDSITITVNQTPTIGTITGDSIICQGISTQWCTQAGLSSYLWSTGATTQCATLNTTATYTVTITAANGCTNTSSKSLTVVNPACTIAGAGGVCSGSTQWCAPAGLSSYLWSTGATTQCISVSTAGNYTVTVTDAIGCTSSCSKTLLVYGFPACSITGSGTICSGSLTQWCAQGGATSYLWSTGATTQCIALGTAGNFTVTVTNAGGCSSTCSKTLVVSGIAPACSITGFGTICPGSSTQWCAPAGLSSYLWSTGGTSQCMTSNTAGTYTVTLTDATGCTNSCSKTLNIATPTCTIDNASSSCQYPGVWCAVTTGSNYLWSTGSTSYCIYITTSGNYTVTVTNSAGGCTSSCSKMITVTPPPPCSITPNGNICSGGSVQWCGPAGLNYGYYWSTGATTQCVTLNTAGNYTLTVVNNGCSTTCTQALVIASPTCSITGNGTICSGGSTQWCAPSASGVSSYMWSTGATTQCITIGAAGNYTVTVTNAGGCTSTCSKTLTVNPVPTCSITGSGSICSGSSTQWCAPVGLSSYYWNTGATTQCITVSAAGNYTVTVTNASVCSSTCSKTLTLNSSPTCFITGSAIICQGNSIQWCAPTGLSSYLWSTGATTQCITLNSAGNYTVTVTNTNGCSSTCSKTLAISNPLCSITGSGTICSGNSTQWCAPAGLSSYLWSTGGTSQCITLSTAGNYTVTVTDANGCSSTCSKTLVIAPPACSITGNGAICSGSSTQWCAPAGLSSYLWSTGATTQCITLSSAGNYTVTVTDGGGCSSTCSKTLAVNTNPGCSITGSGTICSATSAQWCAPSGLTSYVWSTGATTKCITVNTAATYTVTVTNSSGCTGSCTKKLKVTALPAKPGTITATGGNTKVCSGDSKTYSINAVSGAVSYTWTPPVGGVIASGQGTISVTVNFTSGFVTDSIKVAAVNSCGVTGDYRALKITKGNPPAKPGAVAGQLFGVCGNSGVPYSVTNVAGVTYNWTVSNTNTSIAGGQGTSSCTVNFSPTLSGAISLIVTPSNSCGTGIHSGIVIIGGPDKPGNIAGATTVCANQAGVPYSIAPIAGAVNYTWVAPTGGHVSDGAVTSPSNSLLTTATNVTVNFGGTSGNVKVRGNNTCGHGTYKTLAVTFNCREANSVSTFDVNLFPNPADDELTVSFNSREQSSYSIKVNDIIGNTLLVKTGVSEKGENSFKLSLEDISPGVYLVEIKNGDMSRVMKLLVN